MTRRLARVLLATVATAGVAGVLGVLGAVDGSGVAGAAPAAPVDLSGFEQITAYRSELAIERDGSMRVVETIEYDFGSTPRHGIYRYIPYRYRYEPRPDFDRVYRIDDIAVATSEGTPSDLSVSREDGQVNIRIGDPDTTITGRHLYAISYRVRGAINGFPDHDELYWNVIGDEWAVPIENASAVVATPAPITAVACYTGETGSRLPCDSAGFDGRVARFTQPVLSGSSNLTVVVGFETGVIPAEGTAPILEERWSLRRAFGLEPGAVGLAGLATVGVVGGILVLARRGRDDRFAGGPVDAAFGGSAVESVPLFERNTAPVEFTPPDGLRPGQVGTLVDERADVVDVTATIVDLARRGYLRIEEIPKSSWFSKPDWRLVRLREPTDLLPYERVLFNGLFRSDDTVKLSSLRYQFAPRMRQVREALMEDAVERGWFVHRPDRVRAGWLFLGMVALLASAGLLAYLVAATRYALVGIPLVLGALALLVLSRRMPRRTAKGHAVLLRTLGFKQFIETSESRRAEFAERAQLFTEYLPYAIVFGCVDRWAKAFEGLGLEQIDTAGWYVAAHALDFDSFGDALQTFTVMSAGTLVATAGSGGSSGFSGGGGSSGGGGGGGGGGSW